MKLPGIDDKWLTEQAFQPMAMMALKDVGVTAWDTTELSHGRNGPSQTGAPDIMGVGPDGRFVACELKSAKGEPTRPQERVGESIEEDGGLYRVCRTVREVLAAFGEDGECAG